METEQAGGLRTADLPKVESRPVAELKTAARNARTHSDRQIEQIAASIRQFGFTAPVLVDDDDVIVAGHGRVEGARRLGLTQIPVIRLSHLTRDELRAYALADNKVAQNAGWDSELLRIELQELAALDLDFDLEITGFGTTEIDILLDQSVVEEEATGAGEIDISPRPLVQLGDLWQLGEHRLFCGDALERSSFETLMGEDRARMVFTDAPYNVKIDGHVCGLGEIRHAEFQMAAGEMSKAEFTEFLTTAFRHEAEFSVDGAIHYQCMDWRHIGEMMAAGSEVYGSFLNLCVWSKDNGGMGTFYRSKHELVFVWKVGTAAHLNNVELGKNGRYRTNVWEYPAASKTGRNADLKLHPTVKPVTMIMDAIKDASRIGDIVLDCFGGSGSTLIAAEKTRRRARLIELEPGYCEVTITRWQKLTGKAAVLCATGETYEEVLLRRLSAEAAADAALDEEGAA